MKSVLNIFFETAQFNNKAESKTLEELEITKSGLCAIQSAWFIQECQRNGHQARRMTLCNIPYPNTYHSVAEALIDNKWCIFDISTGVAFIDQGSLLSWTEACNYAKTNQRAPNKLLIGKPIYDFPPSSEGYTLCPLYKCRFCDKADGLYDRYYGTNNLANSQEYWVENNGWKAYSSLTNEYIRDLTIEEKK